MNPTAARFIARATLALCLLAGVFVQASANTIRFTNTTLEPIDLTSDLVVDADGNLHVSCRKDNAADPACAGLTVGAPPGAAPVLSFTASRLAVDLADANKNVTLSWSNLPAADVCQATGNSLASGQNWPGPRAGSGQITFTYSAIGTYTYTLACYNAGGKSLDVSLSVVVTSTTAPPPPPPVDGCQVSKDSIADPFQRSLFQPETLQMQERTWSQLWGGGVTYPQGITGEPYPIGSWTISGSVFSPAVSLRGKYITVPFVGNGQSYQFNWIQAKPVAAYGYTSSRATDFKYVTISTCKGDFRIAGSFQFTSPNPSTDPTFVKQCRNMVLAETSIFYGPNGSNTVCEVRSGATYYLNIVFANPNDGLTATESGCRNTSTGVCETSWRHLVN